MERIFVRIDQLEFDPENPRIPTIRRNGSIENTLDYFLRKGNIEELMQSIGEQGWVDLEPMIVVPNGKKYTVIEGNRRLASLILLNHPEIAPFKKQTIQEIVDAANVIPTEIQVLKYDNKNEVLNYLGYRHITGVDEWDSLAKARYLRLLAEHNGAETGLKGNELYKQLARLIGSQPNYVHKLLKGYFLYDKIQENGYYDTGLTDETFSFSLLTTALSYSGINDYAEVKPTEDNQSWTYSDDHLKDLVVWIFKEDSEGNKRVSESRELKTLNAVVANVRALKVFKDDKQPLEYARRFTDEPIEFFNKAVEDAHRLVDDALYQLQFIDDVPKYSIESVHRLQRKIGTLYSGLKNLDSSDDNF